MSERWRLKQVLPGKIGYATTDIVSVLRIALNELTYMCPTSFTPDYWPPVE